MPTPPKPDDTPATGASPAIQPKPVDQLATAPSPSPDPVPTIDADMAAKLAKSRGYVVAPGRTIDGKQPGESVDLGEADAKRLLDLGFILDDDGSRHVREGGPAVNVEDGVQVKPA